MRWPSKSRTVTIWRWCSPASVTTATRERDSNVESLLALEMVRVTEAAAIEAARHMGRGDNEAADQAAVQAMRRTFDDVDLAGTIVIGEGERDEAPMLFIGESV